MGATPRGTRPPQRSGGGRGCTAHRALPHPLVGSFTKKRAAVQGSSARPAVDLYLHVAAGAPPKTLPTAPRAAPPHRITVQAGLPVSQGPAPCSSKPPRPALPCAAAGRLWSAQCSWGRHWPCRACKQRANLAAATGPRDGLVAIHCGEPAAAQQERGGDSRPTGGGPAKPGPMDCWPIGGWLHRKFIWCTKVSRGRGSLGGRRRELGRRKLAQKLYRGPCGA